MDFTLQRKELGNVQPLAVITGGNCISLDLLWLAVNEFRIKYYYSLLHSISYGREDINPSGRYILIPFYRWIVHNGWRHTFYHHQRNANHEHNYGRSKTYRSALYGNNCNTPPINHRWQPWYWYINHNYRDPFVHAPSQWETTLQCNVVSHWLGVYIR